MKQITATVISNNEVMPGAYLIWLESPRIASVAQPGQFVMVHCGEETLLRRPLSIHQLADGSQLAFLFNIVGKGTHWLAQCQADDKIDLLGPLGNGYSIHPESQNLLLLAGGIGIAPLYSLAQDALKKKYSVTLLYGTTDKKRYSISPQIKLASATEDGSVGKKGLITDFIPEYIDWADQIFACGPLPMYKAMARIPELKGKPAQVSLEVRMGCGRGVCYGCTVETKQGLKQVCQDGPVFNLDDIHWDNLIL
ncbi:dihydroorotate dehydrogenase electron transfer subunit [Chloroflexota bacterium]